MNVIQRPNKSTNLKFRLKRKDCQWIPEEFESSRESDSEIMDELKSHLRMPIEGAIWRYEATNGE